MKKAVCLIFISMVLMSCKRSAESPYVMQKLLLGTSVAVKFYAPEAQASKAANEIFDFLQQLHDTVNVFDKESEISRLNRSAGIKPFKCSDLLWDILQAGRRGYEISEGCFDISTGPLMRLWGFHRKRSQWPSELEIAKVKALVGLDKVKFNDAEKSVAFSVEGMYLDFGGIAKGFALDRCRQIAEDNGIVCGVIDLGGNVYCFSTPPEEREFYNVGIRKPRNGGFSDVLKIKNRFVATSGDYERFTFIDGKRVTHIVDPRTGLPIENRGSVSVVTAGGVESDIFSTAIFVGGEVMAKKLVGKNPELQYMIIDFQENGKFKYSVFGDVWHKENSSK